MTRYFGYVRVSTETQVDGNGLEVQKQAIEKYAGLHGLKLDRVYADEGLSGAQGGMADTLDRPELNELLCELAEGDTIIVHNTSRLWRDLFAQATVMKAVIRAKANILSIDEPHFDVYRYMSDPNCVMLSSILLGLDQWERLTVVRKLARGRAEKAQTGAKPAGACPYGYQYTPDKKNVTPIQAEAAAVKVMFSEAQKGRSLSQIAKTLADAGIQTRRGQAWSRGSIRAVLRNRFYAGVLVYGGQAIQGTHTPIISKIQFGKVQAQLAKHAK